MSFARFTRFFLPSERAFALLAGLYAAGGYAFAKVHGLEGSFHPLLYLETGLLFGRMLLFAYVAFWGLWALHAMIAVRPPDLRGYLVADLRRNALNPERLLRALPMLVLVAVMLSVFTSLKVMIPAAAPFSWDPAFAELDAILHGGVDPWRLLQPVLGYPAVTIAVNAIYNAWIAVLYVVVFWTVFSLRRPLARMRFFFAFALAWIVTGTVLALLFSSAGPCYFEAVTGDARFAPLMDYLGSVKVGGNSLWAIRTQESLWQYYEQSVTGIGAGISAMPSIHVATAFLFLLAAWSAHPVLRAAAVAFFLVILLGSVHLGWHYAVDGYVAILTTGAIWVFAGKLVEWLEKAKMGSYCSTGVEQQADEASC